MKIWDCVIIGDGPAGLSAGVYMSRAEHTNLIIGSGTGRWHYGQINQNYLGFPKGIKVNELRQLGLEQAKNYGSKFSACKVTEIKYEDNLYMLTCSDGTNCQAKTIIYCAGVSDVWPKNLDIERWVGNFVFWCITCDGYRARDRKILVVANRSSSVESIKQFLDFTGDITVIPNLDDTFLAEESIIELEASGITIMYESMTAVTSDKDTFVVSIGANEYRFSMCFSLLGSKPRTELLVENKLCDLNNKGYVIINDKNRTSNPTLFAAGDITDKHAHQVATAVHEGAQAAQAATYYLYKHS